MVFNVSGGGGASLNFKVVGSSTAPTNTSENTIWVNTSTPITSWVFSTTEPRSAEAGMVWIFTGTYSSVKFNALKKNNVQIYPLFAKQYVSGVWVDKTAKSYQGGVWVDWILKIYDTGTSYETFVNSDTYSFGGYSAAVGEAPARGSVSFDDTDITLSVNSGTASDSSSYFIGTKNPINVEGFSRLIVEFSHLTITSPGSDSWTNGNYVCVSASPSKQFPQTSGSYKRIHISGAQTVEIDISSFDTAYIVIYGHVYNTGNTCNAKIRRIELR